SIGFMQNDLLARGAGAAAQLELDERQNLRQDQIQRLTGLLQAINLGGDFNVETLANELASVEQEASSSGTTSSVTVPTELEELMGASQASNANTAAFSAQATATNQMLQNQLGLLDLQSQARSRDLQTVLQALAAI